MLCITNNSIKHQSFAYTQLNDQTFLFQTTQFSMSTKLNGSKYSHVSLTIQLNISHLFIHSSLIKQFYCELNYYDLKIRRTPTHDIRKHWTAVSTLLGIISCVYRDQLSSVSVCRVTEQLITVYTADET